MDKPKQQKISPSSDAELLECFDDQGNSIEPKPRGELHAKPYTTWHAVTNVWILDGQGRILCSRRSEHVSGNPGKWQTYFGGHVKADSSFVKTAQAELAEEIGLTVSEEQLKLVDSGKREDVMHMYENYAFLFGGNVSELNFSDGEVAEVKWFSFEDYQASKNDHPDDWCNSMNASQYAKILVALNIRY